MTTSSKLQNDSNSHVISTLASVILRYCSLTIRFLQSIKFSMCPSNLSAFLFVSLSSTLLIGFSGNIMNEVEVSFTVVDVYTLN